MPARDLIIASTIILALKNMTNRSMNLQTRYEDMKVFRFKRDWDKSACVTSFSNV